MHDVITTKISCPYCWEAFSIQIDPSMEAGESYVEDCYVCCRPIEIVVVKIDDEYAQVRVFKIEGNEY